MEANEYDPADDWQETTEYDDLDVESGVRHGIEEGLEPEEAGFLRGYLGVEE